jgi:DNA recombination protein RmuC
MEWTWLVVGFVAGAALSGAVVWARERSRTATLRAELSATTQQLADTEALRAEGERLRIEAARFESERNAAAEKAQWVERSQETLRDVFTAIASQALTTNSEQFLSRTREQLSALLDQLRGDWSTQKEELKGLVSPLKESLTTLDTQIHSLEEKREGAYKSIEQQIRGLGEAQIQLQSTTTTLTQAMKSSTARGRWGELQLRRIAELSGMVDHVDFTEQPTTDEGRPDMIVHLPNGGVLPIDAKASATAYLAAMEADGEGRRAKLVENAKAMRLRIQDLAKRQYWAQFPTAPELVVMFVPIESALAAAFELDEDLLEYGIQQRILVASPITLLALLRTVAFGWQQHRIADNARAIAEQGRELYDRVVNVLKPIRDAGAHLGRSVDAYNQAVGSLEQRLLPGFRRFKELVAHEKEAPELEPIEQTPRLPMEGNQ